MTLFGVKRYIGDDDLEDKVSLKRKADSGIERLISKVKLKKQKLSKKQKATDVENQVNEVDFSRSKQNKCVENDSRTFNQDDEIDFPRSKPKKFDKNISKTSKKFTTSKNTVQKNIVPLNKEEKEIATKLEKNAQKEALPVINKKAATMNTSDKKKKAKVTNNGSNSGSSKEKLDNHYKVERRLPYWLANPHVIEDDLSAYGSMDCSKMKIDKLLIENLSKIGITRFFPVQFHTLSVILNGAMFGVGPCNYPPNDLCVSAPTGSGKTLAFALPIVQCLLNRVVPATRALVLLPTQELAAQVHSVFNVLCDGTSLKCALITGGVQSINEEQEVLIKYRNGQRFQVDIIVATPGRLVNHLTPPNSLCLDYLRFLVIDEADRMMSNIKSNWLQVVEKTVYKNRRRTDTVTMDSINKPAIPLQKLLFSATLSADPVKLEELNLFQPQLYSAHFKPKLNSSNDETTAQQKFEKYVTPALLKEFMVVVSAKNKPLAVLHLIRGAKKVLCFTSSVESATRLSMLIQLFAKKCGFEDNFSCAEFSSKMNATKRRTVLKQFEEGSTNVLVSSDAMARGIDVPEVSVVILYDVPSLIETYIHRVGRTARAGKVGTAYTITLPSEAFSFKQMLKSSGKSIKKKAIPKSVFAKLQPNYETALQALKKKFRTKK